MTTDNRVDHTHDSATYARLISSLELLQRALDRAADNAGLREGGTLGDAANRLRRIATDLSNLTGLDHHHLVPAHEGASTGVLFLGSTELLANARAADWWQDNHAQAAAPSGDAVSAAYL